MTRTAEVRILKGHPGIGQTVEGVALVALDNFSARYDLDRLKGVFSRPQHKLFGQSYVDKILILNAAKGGVASAWMLREMVSRNMGPKALVLNFANPIMAQGAAYADLPLLDRFEQDVTGFVETGDIVEVNPAAGRLTIIRRTQDDIDSSTS